MSEFYVCPYCNTRLTKHYNICPICNKWLVETEVEKKRQDMAKIPREWRCKTCKTIFWLPSEKVSQFDTNSFERMAFCPTCKKPRFVHPILRRKTS